MTSGGPVPGRVPALIARLGTASAVFACIALPALVAGVRLDGPAAPGEVQRLSAAACGESGSLLADTFVAATVGGGDASGTDALVRARIGQLAAWFVVSALVYVAGSLARGRLLGIAGCLALAALPPVHAAGQVLRPEVWASAFALLGLVLCQCLCAGRRPRRVTVPLALAAALAVGAVPAAVPTMGVALLVPEVPFLLTAVQAMLRALRIGARRTFLVVPARAITARLWGPALAALLAPVAALLLMVQCVQGEGPPSTAIAVTLLPQALLPRVTLLALAASGGLAFLLGAGVRFGRGGRLGPELVLAAFCATQLLHPQFAGERDPTPALAALALLVAHGALALIAATAWWLRRRT